MSKHRIPRLARSTAVEWRASQLHFWGAIYFSSPHTPVSFPSGGLARLARPKSARTKRSGKPWLKGGHRDDNVLAVEELQSFEHLRH